MSAKIITSTISAILALNFTMVQNTPAESNVTADNTKENMGDMFNIQGMEKCYGVAKAGANDCGTSTHNCAGESKLNNDKEAWIAVPTGLCQKIVGGSLKSETDKA